MALQASCLNADRMCEIEAGAVGGVAGAGEFVAAGAVAEVLDEVGFPVGGAVAEVGGVEGGFLIGIVGVVLLDVVKDGGGGEEGDGLRKESAVLVASLGEIRGNRLLRVDAGRSSAGGEQASFAKDGVFGFLLQEGACLEVRQNKAQGEDTDEQNVELYEEFQVVLLTCFWLNCLELRDLAVEFVRSSCMKGDYACKAAATAMFEMLRSRRGTVLRGGPCNDSASNGYPQKWSWA